MDEQSRRLWELRQARRGRYPLLVLGIALSLLLPPLIVMSVVGAALMTDTRPQQYRWVKTLDPRDGWVAGPPATVAVVGSAPVTGCRAIDAAGRELAVRTDEDAQLITVPSPPRDVQISCATGHALRMIDAADLAVLRRGYSTPMRPIWLSLMVDAVALAATVTVWVGFWRQNRRYQRLRSG